MKQEHGILVVEDTASLRTSMETILRNAGFGVVGVSDAETAMQAFKKHPPCLILLDILLPKIDGWEFLDGLRKLPKGAKTPVFVLSQLGEPEYRKRAKELGVLKYFVKTDFSLHEILEAVRSVIARCSCMPSKGTKKTPKKI